jgi:dUTPase
MNQFPIDSAVDGLSNLLFLRSLSRRVRVFNKSKFPLPAYKHMFDSGMDVQANIDEPILVSCSGGKT